MASTKSTTVPTVVTKVKNKTEVAAAANSLYGAAAFICFSGALLSKPHLFLIAFVRIFVYVSVASDKQGSNGKLI